MMTYTLPDLPYDYSALAPHIAPEIMELHHDKHHATYVKGANTAVEQIAEAVDKGDFATINKLEKDLAFNLGGHINHSVFWTNMSPEGGGEPTGEVGEAIGADFGGYETFQKMFTANALGVQGSGWSVLAYDTLGQRLNLLQVFDHQGNLPAGQVPVLLLDMWEHAFYLQYKNVKPDFVKAWWNVVNWDDASKRLAAAKAAKVF
ncbi:superoxide dismutase [Naumannella sp. ID2617S]|uniref:Superoxide dismutase n=1 Tax=Enemella dayhoffiae TaxID=2016507 RepID=A0A255H8C4_9ACTN|nr:superoxide dismutase [Enemella dayhoffiae]NNG18143.1 superoxide dismutase [Naumannella sp. ID2617S]OYO23928.1 superoxide dismutase [Enemella dayhoffiae]